MKTNKIVYSNTSVIFQKMWPNKNRTQNPGAVLHFFQTSPLVEESEDSPRSAIHAVSSASQLFSAVNLTSHPVGKKSNETITIKTASPCTESQPHAIHTVIFTNLHCNLQTTKLTWMKRIYTKHSTDPCRFNAILCKKYLHVFNISVNNVIGTFFHSAQPMTLLQIKTSFLRTEI